MSSYKTRVETALAAYLPPIDASPTRLHQAMHYSVLNGGKRLRPALVYATGTALGLDLQQLDAAACAVELIHAYSLIHDDLPAMDNDDWRRGQPTCHKAFDEATAILAGDALQGLQRVVQTLGGVVVGRVDRRGRLAIAHETIDGFDDVEQQHPGVCRTEIDG